MLRNLSLLFAVGVSLMASHVYAVEVSDAVMTTAVVDREPIDHVDVFPRQSGTLYCFNQVVGAPGETVVYHLWYYGEELMSRVALPVKSPSWRTWSAKELLDDRPGAWRVEIQDADGNPLKELSFELR